MATETPETGIDAPIAIVSLTIEGSRLGERLSAALPGSVRVLPARLAPDPVPPGMIPFERLRDVVGDVFHEFRAICFIMATGIVVRHIAPLLAHKASDPAVVVMDEKGRYAVSLLSGHQGGANRLTEHLARITGGQAVITTASDVEEKPALDLIARDFGMEIGNPAVLPRVARAILEDESLWVFDPEGLVTARLAGCAVVSLPGRKEGFDGTVRPDAPDSLDAIPNPLPEGPGVLVTDRLVTAGETCLVLRPRSLVVGLGCNRGTDPSELFDLLTGTFREAGLALRSIRNLASVDVKRDERAILEAARSLKRPVHFFKRQELDGVEVPNPSAVVRKHLGVGSVCEAAALLSAQTDRLVVPKKKTRNVTLAVARAGSTS